MTAKQTQLNVKAIFFDVDGTLLSFETGRIPDSTMAALKRAKEQGILLFVASGRHKNALGYYPQIEEIGFHGFVTLNGGYCYSGERVIHKQAIERRDVNIMVDYVMDSVVPCLFMTDNSMFLSCVNDLVRTVHSAINDRLPVVDDPFQALHHDIYQMCLYTPSNQIPPIIERLRGCSYTQWFSHGMDIVPKGSSKWTGISKMMQQFHLLPEEVAAFGDGSNDLEMLWGVGYPVVMGNAPSHVKAAGLVVTDDVEHDGVSNAMNLFLR